MPIFLQAGTGRLTAPNHDGEDNRAYPMYSVKRKSPVPCAIAVDDRSEAMSNYSRLTQFLRFKLTLNFSPFFVETVMSAINSGFWINWGMFLLSDLLWLDSRVFPHTIRAVRGRVFLANAMFCPSSDTFDNDCAGWTLPPATDNPA
jgi:hypothetical protein